MNTIQAAILARLKDAGLVDLAERAARRGELRLAHCIDPGEVTGAHTLLWRTLAAAGQSNAQIAKLVMRPVAEISEILAPPARPTPAPESGVRIKETLSAKDVAAMIEAAVAPLRAQIAKLRPRAKRRAVFDADAWLSARGDLGREVRAIATKRGIPIALLLSSNHGKAVKAARQECVALLSSRGLSHREASAFLRRWPGYAYETLCETRKAAA